MIPDGQERAELQIAGLGEKRITISAFADAREIYDELAFQYSKLTESGGFELLRVPEGGKNLDVIACPSSGYTVSYLRAVVHHAKIYIRPLQKDLSLEPLKEPVSLLTLCNKKNFLMFVVHVELLCATTRIMLKMWGVGVSHSSERAHCSL